MKNEKKENESYCRKYTYRRHCIVNSHTRNFDIQNFCDFIEAREFKF